MAKTVDELVSQPGAKVAIWRTRELREDEINPVKETPQKAQLSGRTKVVTRMGSAPGAWPIVWGDHEVPEEEI